MNSLRDRGSEFEPEILDMAWTTRKKKIQLQWIRELEHVLLQQCLAEHRRRLQSHHAARHLQIRCTSRVEAS